MGVTRSRGRKGTVLLFLVMLAMALGWTAAPVNAGPTDTPTFAELYESAKGAYDRKDYLEAAALLRRAYELAPDAKLLWNIGRSAELAGEYEAALEAYRQYLATVPSAKEKASTEKRILEVKAAFGKGWLTIVADTDGATARIDGGEPVTLPVLRHLLPKGRHDVTVTAQGHLDARVFAIIAAGEPSDLSVALAKAPAEVPAIASHPEDEDQGATLATWGWVTAGTGAALAIGGATLMGLAHADKATIDAAPVDATGRVTGTTRQGALDLQQSALTKSQAGIGLLVAGGAAVTTGIVLLVLDTDDEQPLTVSPSLMTPGLVFGGSF